MLKSLHLSAFKCVDEVTLTLAPLTLLTGPNAAGKSTVIQAILLAASCFEQTHSAYMRDVVKPFSQFDDVLCRWSEKDHATINLSLNPGSVTLRVEREYIKFDSDLPQAPWLYEESLFYLAANRFGPEELSELNNQMRIGPKAQFALGHLEQSKDKPVHEALCQPNAPSKTLKAQLAWWLTQIIGTPTEARTEKITATSVKTSFNMGDIESVSPFNTGAGNSYLLKLLILCLAAKPGDLLLIENPEIHLHPGAQSRLGAFLGFMAANGVQMIIETHCEHLINRIRYEVYKKQCTPDDVTLYYKADQKADFELLKINQRGHFCDTTGAETNFPSGFFDSTLSELLEIG